MRPRRLFPAAAACVAVVALGGTAARGQNDWQYPDPYFGILEIEKSHDAATTRRYRAEVNPTPRGTWRGPAEPRQTTPKAGAATSAVPDRHRWRNRWRR